MDTLLVPPVDNGKVQVFERKVSNLTSYQAFGVGWGVISSNPHWASKNKIAISTCFAIFCWFFCAKTGKRQNGIYSIVLSVLLMLGMTRASSTSGCRMRRMIWYLFESRRILSVIPSPWAPRPPWDWKTLGTGFSRDCRGKQDDFDLYCGEGAAYRTFEECTKACEAHLAKCDYNKELENFTSLQSACNMNDIETAPLPKRGQHPRHRCLQLRKDGRAWALAATQTTRRDALEKSETEESMFLWGLHQARRNRLGG